MSKRQVIVLWILALVLTAAVFAVRSGSDESFTGATDRSRGQTLLDDFPAAEVARMSISDGTDSVTLEKAGSGWQVAERDDYPADVQSINDVIRTLAAVEVTQGIEADPKYAPRFGMDPEAGEPEDHGTTVALANDAGTELARLTLGKELEAAANPMSPFGGGSTGRFVRNEADNSGIYVVSELFPTLDADPAQWLDDNFLKVEKIESVSVSEPGKPDSTAWTLTRKDETANFELEGIADDETLDTSATSPLKNLFSYARFEDIVPADEADGAWQDDEKRKAVVKTFEGFEYVVHFAPKKPDADADATSDAYLMSVEVSAEIPAERKAEEGESEEDAKTKQEAFEERRKTLSEKLETDKSFTGRTFQVSKFTVDALLKDRAGLLQSESTAAQPGQPGMQGMPGAPGGARPSRPVQAVTPPIAIPPLPSEDAEGGEDGE